jgi:crotonobetainyl-CoA:carnitine CoA-transferase CaiB-like acyl-CoA transferase
VPIDEEVRRPLSGITIADFSWVLAGPRCTSWLGAMGARVIKIEGPRRPDQFRSIAIHAPRHDDAESSGAFHGLNFSKLGCTIDFTLPDGVALARRLIAVSDVVIENFAYGVMQKVGLTYDVVSKIRPDIIMVSSSAMGQTGPDRAHVAYGNLLHTFSGLNSVTGYPGRDAGSVGGTFTDPLTGTTLVFAVLAALWHRRRTGEGQFIDVAMTEATMMQLPEFILDYTVNGRVATPRGNEDGVAAPNNCYPCRGDDAWIAISVRDEDEWAALRRALGEPAWTRDPRFTSQLARFENRDALDAHVAAWTRQFAPADAADLLQAAGVAAGPSHTAAEVYGDPHFRSRGFFVDVDHPVVGTKPVTRLPWLLEPGPNGQYWPAPLLGQHNDEVFRKVLGLSDDEIDELRAKGVIL